MALSATASRDASFLALAESVADVINEEIVRRVSKTSTLDDPGTMRQSMTSEELLQAIGKAGMNYPRQAVAFVAISHLVGAARSLQLKRSELQPVLYSMNNQQQVFDRWPGGEKASKDQVAKFAVEVSRLLWRAKLNARAIVNVFATVLLALYKFGLTTEYVESMLNEEWNATAKNPSN